MVGEKGKLMNKINISQSDGNNDIKITQEDGVTQICVNGKWIKATPEPYYPSVIEKLKCVIGFHVFPYTGEKTCLVCGKHFKEQS